MNHLFSGGHESLKPNFTEAENNGFYGCWHYLNLEVLLWVNYNVNLQAALCLT
jgi:hypothetical protein